MADAITISALLVARDQASGTIKRVGQNVGQLGMSMVKLGAPLAALGALSLKTFAGFEKSMVRVGAVSGATADELENLTALAKEMGRTTIFSATESAEALAFLAQAGQTATEALESLPSVLQLAAAGGIELASAADIVTNVMAGMELEVNDLGRANDVLVTAFTSANTNLQQLGQAFKFVGPVAAAAGLSLEDTASALALMGNAGLQASMAGTGLRGSITKLLNPSKEAAQAMSRLGVNVFEADGSLRDFATIVGEFERVGLDAADAMTIFGMRAGPAMLALVSQGSDALVDLRTKMEGAGGVAENIAAAQMNTLTGSMAELKAGVEGVAISIGESLAPAVRGLTDDLTPLLAGISEWVEKNPDLTAGIVGSAVALVAIGTALTAINLVAPAVIGALAAIGVALGIGVGGAALLVVGVAAAIGLLITNQDKLEELMDVVPEATKPGFSMSDAFAEEFTMINIVTTVALAEREKMFKDHFGRLQTIVSLAADMRERTVNSSDPGFWVTPPVVPPGVSLKELFEGENIFAGPSADEGVGFWEGMGPTEAGKARLMASIKTTGEAASKVASQVRADFLAQVEADADTFAKSWAGAQEKLSDEMIKSAFAGKEMIKFFNTSTGELVEMSRAAFVAADGLAALTNEATGFEKAQQEREDLFWAEQALIIEKDTAKVGQIQFELIMQQRTEKAALADEAERLLRIEQERVALLDKERADAIARSRLSANLIAASAINPGGFRGLGPGGEWRGANQQGQTVGAISGEALAMFAAMLKSGEISSAKSAGGGGFVVDDRVLGVVEMDGEAIGRLLDKRQTEELANEN